MARAKIATVDCGIMAKFKTKFKSSCSKKAPFTENISNLWSKETAGGFLLLNNHQAQALNLFCCRPTILSSLLPKRCEPEPGP